MSEVTVHYSGDLLEDTSKDLHSFKLDQYEAKNGKQLFFIDII